MSQTKHTCPPGLLIALVAATLMMLLPAMASANPPLAPSQAKTYDDELAEMADEMPGFGGWYMDEDGRMNAFMTDTSSRHARALQAEDVAVKSGQYNFRQLLTWKRALRNEVLSRPGVLSLDIDESRNRIVVGIQEGTGKAAVQELLAELDLPNESVLIEKAEPMRFATSTLRTYDRYRKGGLQIQYVAGFNTFNCTLGFIAYHQGTISPPPGYSNRGLVTASHCSSNQGAVDGTGFHHPTTSYGQFAHELIDPPFFFGNGCPAGRRCRFSDAAFATYHPLRGSSGSTIARTQSRDRNNGTLNRSTRRLTLVREAANATLGTWLDKMGRTTGWTYGNVNATCSDTNVANSNITLLCQNTVRAGAAGGDSGGPVFDWMGNDYAVLHGVLWGTDGTNFAYSPLGQVEQELGPLTASRRVPPIARISSIPGTTGPFGTSYTFSGSGSSDPDGGSIQNYSWRLNGGTIPGSSSSFTRTLAPGNNTVQLTVTDDEGATASTTRSVYVFDDSCEEFRICPIFE
ncbi:MAG: PKD domain-containing protein [Acidobacteriota bacterium]